MRCETHSLVCTSKAAITCASKCEEIERRGQRENRFSTLDIKDLKEKNHEEDQVDVKCARSIIRLFSL
jgi:hypothetical protein